MRFIVIIILLCFFELRSQPFIKTSGQPLSFREMQRQFGDFKKQKDLSQEKYWKHFKRYEADMVLHCNGHGEPAGFSEFIREALAATTHPSNTRVLADPWSPTGPSVLPDNLQGYAPNGMGRINCVAFHPTDTNTWYVGVAQGGLWKTVNNGASYTPLTDNLPNIRISDICLDPNDPNTIYISLCDFAYVDKGLYLDGRKRHTHYGLGVYKSTDGGGTWSATGLTFQNTQGDASLIKKIFINPANSTELLACGVSGMYRSTNSGVSWTKKLDTLFWDMERHPSAPSTIYAASGWLRNADIGNAGVYKSTDFGNTWTQLNTNMPAQGTIQRVDLAIAPGNPSNIYALTCDDLGGFYAIYQSTDAGASWNFKPNAPNILDWNQGSDQGGQGVYDLAICVNDTNENLIYTGGINMWASHDAGENFKKVTHWTYQFGTNTIHADIHNIQQQPVSKHYFVSTDGGLYKAHRIDTSNTGNNWTTDWTFLSSGMQITSFYRLSTARDNSDRLIAGAQDNSTFYRNSGNWSTVFGGDGMDNFIPANSPGELIGSSQFGTFFYSDNDGFSGYILGTNPLFETSEWTAPIAGDYNNPGVLYVGNQNMVRSNDGGFSWSSLASVNSSSVNNQNTEISAIGVSPSNSLVIYATRRVRHELGLKGFVFKIFGGYTSFMGVTSNIPDSLYFTGIEVHPGNPSEAVISMAGFSSGQKVYRTTDGGINWTNISFNLPNLPVNCVKYTGNGGQIMVATDIGIYVFHTINNQWINFSGGLPNVITSDIEINPVTNKVYLSTFGRGIWETSLSAVPFNR